MVFVCKDKCRVHPERTSNGGWLQILDSVYNRGIRKCSVCSQFFKTELWICPCCGTKLGNRPTNNRGRRRKVAEMKRY